MTISDKRLSSNQRRRLMSIRAQLMNMADEWDGRDQFNMSNLIDLADKAEQVATELVVEDNGMVQP